MAENKYLDNTGLAALIAKIKEADAALGTRIENLVTLVGDDSKADGAQDILTRLGAVETSVGIGGEGEGVAADIATLKKILKGYTTEGSVKDAIDAAKKAGDDAADAVDTLDQSLAAVAKSGKAADVALDPTFDAIKVSKDVDGAATLVAAANVQEAIGALASMVADTDAAAALTITDTTTTEGFLKTYTFTQGGTEIGKIDIPKDFLVKSGSVVTAAADGDYVTGSKAGDAFIELVLNVKEGAATDEKIYIAVKDLVDIYSANNATDAQVEVTIDGYKVSAALSTQAAADLADGKAASVYLTDDIKAKIEREAFTEADVYELWDDTAAYVAPATGD